MSMVNEESSLEEEILRWYGGEGPYRCEGYFDGFQYPPSLCILIANMVHQRGNKKRDPKSVMGSP